MSRWTNFKDANAVVASMSFEDKVAAIDRFIGAIITTREKRRFWFLEIADGKRIIVFEQQSADGEWNKKITTIDLVLVDTADRFDPPLMVKTPVEAMDFFTRVKITPGKKGP